MFNFGFGSSETENRQTTTQSQTGYNRSSGRTRQSGSRTIQEAGLTEQEALSTLMQQLYGNMSSARGLVEGGLDEAWQIAADNFNRVIEEGASSAIGQIAKSGFKSSNINSLMGAMTRSAAAPLSQAALNFQANQPMMALNAINATASPVMQMLQGYFLNERSQNVDTSQYGRQFQGSYSGGEGTSTSVGTQSGSSSNFGFSIPMPGGG